MNKKTSTKIILSGMGLVLGYKGMKLMARSLFNTTIDNSVKRIMTDPYGENLWEFVSATSKYTPQVIEETNLRSEEGQVIQRPLGSPKQMPSLNELMFNIAQLYRMPTPLETDVDVKVVIGKHCSRPLEIDLPIMISGMAYGEALSAKAKVALAKGASMAGTATNSGEGPFLPAERKAAKKYILQYNRGFWNKTNEILRKADAIEIQFGQGALPVGHIMYADKMDAALKKAFPLKKGQNAVAHSRQPEVNNHKDLLQLVKKLKRIAGDIPIGAKLGAGKHLEKDIEVAVEAGIDFVVMDGAEAATKGSSPLMQDDFGVPTVFAISRAANYLRENNLRDKVSLVASGKIRTPGDVLKVIALGADAAYIGAIGLFAVSHTQVLGPLPYEPPTQLLWYDGKYAKQFNVNKGALSLAKYLQSCKEEIIEGIRALGKTSINQVCKEDLFAIDELTARGVQVPMAYDSYRTKNVLEETGRDEPANFISDDNWSEKA